MFNAYLLVITKLVPHSLELLPPPCDSFMNIIPFVSTLAGPFFPLSFKDFHRLVSPKTVSLFVPSQVHRRNVSLSLQSLICLASLSGIL